MPKILRRWNQVEAEAVAPYSPCFLCRAALANEAEHKRHETLVHGGPQEFRYRFLLLEARQPHVASIQEGRYIQDRFVTECETVQKGWVACVFFCRQDWAHNRKEVFLASGKSFMKKPSKVAGQLGIENYHAAWPHIPLAQLRASAVALPRAGEDGEPTETSVRLHKRRITAAALKGEERVYVCEGCHEEFRN